MYSEKLLKLYKTISESISSNFPDFFLLKDFSKRNWALEWHLGTRAIKALGYSRHSRHLRTWALGHLATQGTRGFLFSRLKSFQ